jgi:hypothetical protein
MPFSLAATLDGQKAIAELYRLALGAPWAFSE